MPAHLTDKQKNALHQIESYWQSHGMPPSIADLAELLGIGKASAYEHLLALKRKGFLESTETSDRSWRSKRMMPGLCDHKQIPLLGRVAAGRPILAVENHEDMLLFDQPNTHDDYFALRVVGDSMIGANIQDGDIVISRAQATAINGDIVVALLDSENATVKKWVKHKNKAQLLAMNPLYAPIEVTDDRVQILGKVIEIRRTLSR